jgi:hypothetical protein
MTPTTKIATSTIQNTFHKNKSTLIWAAASAIGGFLTLLMVFPIFAISTAVIGCVIGNLWLNYENGESTSYDDSLNSSTSSTTSMPIHYGPTMNVNGIPMVEGTLMDITGHAYGDTGATDTSSSPTIDDSYTSGSFMDFGGCSGCGSSGSMVD